MRGWSNAQHSGLGGGARRREAHRGGRRRDRRADRRARVRQGRPRRDRPRSSGPPRRHRARDRCGRPPPRCRRRGMADRRGSRARPRDRPGSRHRDRAGRRRRRVDRPRRRPGGAAAPPHAGRHPGEPVGRGRPPDHRLARHLARVPRPGAPPADDRAGAQSRQAGAVPDGRRRARPHGRPAESRRVRDPPRRCRRRGRRTRAQHRPHPHGLAQRRRLAAPRRRPGTRGRGPHRGHLPSGRCAPGSPHRPRRRPAHRHPRRPPRARRRRSLGDRRRERDGCRVRRPACGRAGRPGDGRAGRGIRSARAPRRCRGRGRPRGGGAAPARRCWCPPWTAPVRPVGATEVVTLVVHEPALDAHPRGRAVYPVAGSSPCGRRERLHGALALARGSRTGPARPAGRVRDGRPSPPRPPSWTTPQRSRSRGTRHPPCSACRSPTCEVPLASGSPRRLPRPALGHAAAASAARGAIRAVAGLGAAGAWLAGSGLAPVVADAVEEAERVRRAVLWGPDGR